MDYYDYGLIGLFLVCCISSSLWPLGSEGFVIGFLLLDFDPFYVLIIATCGNTLGALSTYYLAYFLGESGVQKYFSSTYDKLKKYTLFVKKYGAVCAFFSFLPVIGDLFVLLLGLHRYNQFFACLFITFGKFIRYFILIYLYNIWNN